MSAASFNVHASSQVPRIEGGSQWIDGPRSPRQQLRPSRAQTRAPEGLNRDTNMSGLGNEKSPEAKGLRGFFNGDALVILTSHCLGSWRTTAPVIGGDHPCRLPVPGGRSGRAGRHRRPAGADQPRVNGRLPGCHPSARPVPVGVGELILPIRRTIPPAISPECPRRVDPS